MRTTLLTVMTGELLTFDRIAVVGAGRVGYRARNCISAGQPHRRCCATRDRRRAERLRDPRESPRLPGIRSRAHCGRALRWIERYDAILLAVPAQDMRDVAHDCARTRSRHAGSRLRQGDRARHAQIHDRGDRGEPCHPHAGDPLGPELRPRCGARSADRGDARGARRATASALACAFGSATFRPYHSTDVRGVEIGGAAKNVLAIAAGIVAGAGSAPAPRAALVTRGFAELFRFGTAFGARPETLDRAVWPGRRDPHLFEPAVAQLLASESRWVRGDPGASVGGKLVEGLFTAPRAGRDGERDVASICRSRAAVVAILGGRTSVDEAIETLLTRPFRAEG